MAIFNLNYIRESKDKSNITKNFKKKTGINFKYLSLEEALKNDIIKNNESVYKNIEYQSTKKNGEVVIDVTNNKYVGYICVTKNKKDGYYALAPLYIEKEYRGYGISNKLMKDAIDKWDAGILGVYSDNEVAINLYKKYGFSIHDTKKYKDGTEVYIMIRKGAK